MDYNQSPEICRSWDFINLFEQVVTFMKFQFLTEATQSSKQEKIGHLLLMKFHALNLLELSFLIFIRFWNIFFTIF